MLHVSRRLLSKMRRRKKSLTIHFFSNMSEISEETEELLLAEDRISERSSTSNCSKEAEKEKRKSEETHKVKADSDTGESELSSDDNSSCSPTEKRKYSEGDMMEEQSANPLIDKAEDSDDPLSQMEMKEFNDDSLEPCPAPCNAPPEQNNRYEVLINCTVASDQLGLSGRFCLHLTPTSLDLENCDTMDTAHSWKYRHIQRFGYNKSTNDFLMVTRHRNKFGHGVFDFHVIGDPRKIIDSLQNKSGCSLRLADSAKRISNLT